MLMKMCLCPDEKVLVFQAFITSQIHGYKLMTLADKYVGGVGDITLWVGVVFYVDIIFVFGKKYPLSCTYF